MKFEEILPVNEQKILLEATFFEMANLYPGDTGLKYVIWLGKVGGQHGPRIKVSNVKGSFAENDNFIMSISKEPVNLTPRYTKISSNDVGDVEDWIKRNYKVLIELWKVYETGTGSAIELLNRLEMI